MRAHRVTPNWWENVGKRRSILELDEGEGYTADICFDHAKAGLALVDEARAKLCRFYSDRAS